MASNFVRKTYADCYLYGNDSKIKDEHNKALFQFILGCTRIEDKNSEAFRGVLSDMKRAQSSSVLYTVLMRDDVVLGYNNVELPASFKVFEAKDVKTETKKSKIFIDVTGLIYYKEGFYYCKDIGKLVTYCFGALTFILYRDYSIKLLNNSNITISSTQCYVYMFEGILDYLRIIGLSENKNKISYMIGLFYLKNVLGKTLDNYTKSVAAKIAEIDNNSIKPYDLYFNEDKDFVNLPAFVNFLVRTFKLKGFTTEVLVSRWMYSYGKGVQYGLELFPAFAYILTSTYCGSYVVNQRQVERCCGTPMVKFATSILSIGAGELSKKGYMEASELDKLEARDKNTEILAEAIAKRSKSPSIKFEESDYSSAGKLKDKFKRVKSYYISTEQEGKLNKLLFAEINRSFRIYDKYIKGTLNKSQFSEESITTLIKSSKEYLSPGNVDKLITTLKEKMEILEEPSTYFGKTKLDKYMADKEVQRRYKDAKFWFRKYYNELNK
jgi:hypothetical protein